MVKQFIRIHLLGCLFMGTLGFSQISDRPDEQIIHQVLLQSGTEQTLNRDDLSYELTDFYKNQKNGIQHIYLRQTYNGLEIVGTESSLHFLPNGKLLKTNNRFVNSISKRGNSTTINPQLSAIQAVQSASDQLGYTITQPLSVISQEFTTNQKAKISNGGISLSDIPARLMYFLKEDGTLALIWELSIQSINKTEWYNVRLDATTGQILNKVNWVSSCGFEHSHDESEDIHYHKDNLVSVEAAQEHTAALLGTYNVFARPLESPFYGDRTLVYADDEVNLNASPYGWHDTNGVEGPEYTTTRGNNVNAYEDGDNYGFQPSGGSDLIFDFPFDPNYSYSNQSESAAITNLFYWNNIIHDVFYEYGFDEVSGNFQQNNYGNGGIGNDYVFAEAQDGSGTCNANFSTPPDGENPTMQMYICGNKDGDFDNLVITHEYGHGISIRLTGGPSISDCLWNNEQMGEGWSDWFGLMITMQEGDEATTPRGIGTYLFGQAPGGGGIRTYPYTTDMSINPHTYNSIKTEAAPHGVGSVWAAMLWDLTWALIDEYGFDSDIYNGTGGNNIALHLVIEGLKLQPCSPGFVDGRDAILAADQALYNGENQCLIWDVFARRGLGSSADQGSSQSKTDGVEAFDTPSSEAEFSAPFSVCEDKGILSGLGGGTPYGGVYSGPGVTDDGNGSTYTFNPEVAGIGVHSITYSVPATACAEASSATGEIEVTEGLQIICASDIEVYASTENCSAIVNYENPTGGSTCPVSDFENFDGISRPNLPEGWTTTNDSGANNPWKTVNTQSSSSPNSVYAENKGSNSVSSLISPNYAIDSPNAKLKFKLSYSTESGYDGALLEYSTNNGVIWKDILNNGGTFVSGAYNTTLGSYLSPFPNRQVWSGSSGGFVQVEINLSPALNNQNVRFRWRMGSDIYVGGNGVWLDDVEVEGIFSEDPITTQIAGLPSGSEFPIGTTVNTFEIVDGNGNTQTCSFNITVIDEIPPVMNCPENQFVGVNPNEAYVLPDYWETGLISAMDNCSELVNPTQNPVAGTNLPIGTHTIEFTVQDASGNETVCSFELKVFNSLGTADVSLSNSIQIYPNPTDNLVTISNNSTYEIQKIMILDLSGKKIQETKWNTVSNETTLSLKHLPSGTYLIQIIGENQTVVKKIVKK